MRCVDLSVLKLREKYTQNELAEIWGYKNYNAIRRGIVTPAGQNLIILFVTEDKEKYAEPYSDKLENGVLTMQGEKKHGNDLRLRNNVQFMKDDIYLFYRKIHHTPFTYYGQVKVIQADLKMDVPSEFKFILLDDQFEMATDELDILCLCRGQDSQAIDSILEGNKKIIQHVVYERSPENRRQAIALHGTKCKICGIDLDLIYGKDISRGYIEIHHINELCNGTQSVNPLEDLIPLCPNCHRMLHRKKKDNVTIEELKERVKSFRSYLEKYTPKA